MYRLYDVALAAMIGLILGVLVGWPVVFVLRVL